MSIRRLETGLRQMVAGLASLVEPTPAKLQQLADDVRSTRLDALQYGYSDVTMAASEAETATQVLLTGKVDARVPCLHAIHDLAKSLLLRLKSEVERAEAGTADKETASPKLLVVDDSRVAATALANAFLHHGFTVRSVSNMEEALAELRDFRPCILVSDVYMPNLDLSRICRTFREQSEGHCGLIVLVSGSSGETLNVLLDSVRPDAFVAKMEGTGAVVDRVLEIWQKRRAPSSCPIKETEGPSGDSAPSSDSNPKGAR